MRMGFFYVPNGMFLPNFHPGGSGGRAFELTPILKPLEPFRDQITVVSGLSNLGVISPNEGGGVHTRAHGGWLNGVLPKRTEGADITAGKTIDQYAADKLGADTPAALARADDRIELHGGQLRERLQLRLLELDVVAHGLDAAAARARSARRLRTHVRRWRQRHGAPG